MTENKEIFWRGTILIWFSHLVMDFMIGIWPVYKTLVTLDLIAAGLIASVGMFIGEGLQLYFGVLSDKGFHQKLLALGIGLTATIPFLSYVENEWILFTLVLSSFIGSGAFHPSASGLLVKWSSHHKNYLIALFACGGMLGAASSQYVFMQLYRYFEGQTWFLAIPVLILTACCYFWPFPQSQGAQPEKQIDFKVILKAIKLNWPSLSLLYLIQVCLQTVVLAFSFLLPDILKTKGCEEWFCLGGGYFYFVMGSAIASLPIGYCVHKWGYRLVLAAVTVSSAGLLSIFLKIEALPLFSMSLLLFLIGSSMGVIVPVVVAGAMNLTPSYASSFISALYMGGCTCLAGFGPVLASILATLFTENAPIFALELLSFLLLAALTLVYFLPHQEPELPETQLLEFVN